MAGTNDKVIGMIIEANPDPPLKGNLAQFKILHEILPFQNSLALYFRETLKSVIS